MGVWGKGLLKNDLAKDIEDLYVEAIQSGENDKAAEAKIVEEILQQLDNEERKIFFVVFAYVQWKYGRLTEENKEKANLVLNDLILNPIQIESNIITAKDYCLVRDKINGLMPKRYKSVQFCTNPWDIGDIYAYQIHSNATIASPFRGKYLIIQKIADTDGADPKYSVVRFLRAIFDNIPSIDQLAGVDTLPLVPYINPPTAIVPPLDYWLKAYMCILSARQYPKNYLHFIKNVEVRKRTYTGNDSLSWAPNSLEDAIISFYLSWEGKEIDQGTEWL